jgi:hypothetical protein
MDAIIARLLAWTVANSGLPAPPQPPVIEYRPTAYFTEQVCEGRIDCSAKAIYLDGTNTIVLNEAVRELKDLHARALLVHEMVHYLQDASGKWTEKNCDSWLEREHQANRLQFHYFSVNGGNPFSHAMPVLDRRRCEQMSAPAR